MTNGGTYTVTRMDWSDTSDEDAFSTSANLEKPNLEIGSWLSRAGKSMSTSPSSSAICSTYASLFVLQ